MSSGEEPKGEHMKGIPAKEPAFGLDAVWIEESERDRAQMLNYTVVDHSTIVATHLTEIIKIHANELLGRQEAQPFKRCCGEEPEACRGAYAGDAVFGHNTKSFAEPAFRKSVDKGLKYYLRNARRLCGKDKRPYDLNGICKRRTCKEHIKAV